MLLRAFAVAAMLFFPAFAISGNFTQDSQSPPEAKLEKLPADARVDKGETRCRDFFVFHPGNEANGQQPKVSYFEQKSGVPPIRFGIQLLERVEVKIDADKQTPTVQVFTQDKTVVKAVFRLTEEQLSKSGCLKSRAEQASK